MCISILSAKYITMNLFCESVFLRFEKGKIFAREIYDLFFTISSDWDKPRIICVSPHNLIKDGAIQAKSIAAPGAGGKDDVVYDTPAGFGKGFRPDEKIFSVKIYDSKIPNNPQTVEFSGQVVVPEISFCDGLEKDTSVADIMKLCGTAFELRLPTLKANVNYAMRLILEPVELLGLSLPRCLDRINPYSIKARWRQEGTITCPRNCLFDYKKLLEDTRQNSASLATSIGAIEAAIYDRHLTIVKARRNRILLILPEGCDLHRETIAGCILPIGAKTASDSRLFCEYYGGTDKYWGDDPSPLSYAIWNYLERWGQAEAKTKESITTALGVPHNNCSLLVDSMTEKKLICVVDEKRGLYKACNVPPETLDRIIEDIATDPEIEDKFAWVGYRIQFAVEFSYVSDKDEKKIRLDNIKSKLTFWLSLTGVILGAAALVGWPLLWKALKYLISIFF